MSNGKQPAPRRGSCSRGRGETASTRRRSSSCRHASLRSVVAAAGDAFDAGKARAALYRQQAGVHDHDDSDDSGRDADLGEQPQPCGLSSATCNLMGVHALSQALNFCANGQQPTGQQPSAGGEENGKEVRCSFFFRRSRRLAGSGAIAD